MCPALRAVLPSVSMSLGSPGAFLGARDSPGAWRLCSRLLCSLHVLETLSQACVRAPIKPIRWRLSATQIKHTGADKQMLTVSVSRHLPVCFLRCDLLTTTSLRAHLVLFVLAAFSFCLIAFGLSQISEVHLGFSSCSPACGFSGSAYGSAHAHRPQGRCKWEIAALGATAPSQWPTCALGQESLVPEKKSV